MQFYRLLIQCVAMLLPLGFYPRIVSSYSNVANIFLFLLSDVLDIIK